MNIDGIDKNQIYILSFFMISRVPQPVKSKDLILLKMYKVSAVISSKSSKLTILFCCFKIKFAYFLPNPIVL